MPLMAVPFKMCLFEKADSIMDRTYHNLVPVAAVYGHDLLLKLGFLKLLIMGSFFSKRRWLGGGSSYYA